ncbi:hypothetical protein GCM10010347_48930 [Streptomyces cirratus]|uniref:Uncharacterized protein n=1 Tax=Streptomyces cirratus TaxID=68187 RepID=A0ABQ3EXY4_9ACTN|nr:hypothetical protein GCM10010347_48930 [Streptomyces cirratus]
MDAVVVAIAAAGTAGFDWTPLWTLAGAVATGAFLLAGHAMVQRSARRQEELKATRDLSKWHRELRRHSYVTVSSRMKRCAT